VPSARRRAVPISSLASSRTCGSGSTRIRTCGARPCSTRCSPSATCAATSPSSGRSAGRGCGRVVRPARACAAGRRSKSPSAWGGRCSGTGWSSRTPLGAGRAPAGSGRRWAGRLLASFASVTRHYGVSAGQLYDTERPPISTLAAEIQSDVQRAGASLLMTHLRAGSPQVPQIHG
jgi:hypothetical protein